MAFLIEDVLTKVFEFLDGNSLKEASLVCKRLKQNNIFLIFKLYFLHFSWNKVIGLSPSLMKKLTLTLSSQTQRDINWVSLIDEIKHINKRFQNLCVGLKWQNCQTEIRALIEISRFHGFHLRNLSLSSACFINSQDFCDILNNLPLLEKLNLQNTRFEMKTNNDQTVAIKKVEMKNLKTVKLDNSSWIFLQFLNSSHLESIEILYGNSNDRTHLMKFLASTPKLKSMTIDASALETIFKEKVEEKFPFRLRKLHILSKFSYETSTKVDRNFYDFMESQRLLEEILFGSSN
jgi:hypothetical protein